jgi:hypothetical protein
MTYRLWYIITCHLAILQAFASDVVTDLGAGLGLKMP